MRDNKFAGFKSQRDDLRCFSCDGRGHRAVDCPRRASASQNKLNSHFFQSYCYKCRSTGHDTKDCRNSSPRTQPHITTIRRTKYWWHFKLNRQIVCAMQALRKIEEKDAEKGTDTLELKTGEKINVLKRACMEAESKDNLPVISGKVGNKNIEVLQDCGCNGVIVEKHFVDEADFIGKVGYMMTVD